MITTLSPYDAHTSNQTMSELVAHGKPLSDEQVFEYQLYGVSENDLRSAVTEHPVLQYIASLSSLESRKKSVSVLQRIIRALEPDVVRTDGAKPNIFTYPWQHVTAADFRLMLNSLSVQAFELSPDGVKEKVIKPASQATKLLMKSIFKQIIGAYTDMKLMSEHEYYAVSRIKVKSVSQPPRGQYIPAEVQKEVTRYASLSRTRRGMRDAAIFGLLLYAGLRRSEIGLVKYADLDFVNRQLSVLGKGNKRVEIPLFDEAWLPLKAYLDAWAPQNDSAYLFTVINKNDTFRDSPLLGAGVRYILGELCSGAGVAPIAPHDLRRTFCTDMIKRFDVQTAQLFMRHENSDTTQRYNMEKEEQKRSARDKLSQLN